MRDLDRRTFLLLGAGAFAVASVPFVLRSRRRLVRRQLPVMGTIADLAVVADGDPRDAQAALDAAYAELTAVDRAMSRFRADSDVGRLNAATPGAAVPVGAATAFVLTEALLWAETSDGAFDPCLGRAVELWDVTHRTEPPAGSGRLAGQRLYRALEVDSWRGAPVALLRRADANVDLGGIAKGWAVDRAVRALRARGVTNALVNVGGDLYALGLSADGDPWRIGVRDPADPARLSATLELRDEAVATSGDYEQGFTWHGRRYHHLLDPETAAPRETGDRHSLTVSAPTCLAADAAATALFGMDDARAAAVLARRAPAARARA